MNNAATLSLPWCEADEDSYTDALQDAIADSDGAINDILTAGPITMSVQVRPAHFSACTLPDAMEAATRAVETHVGGHPLCFVAISGRIFQTSDSPRITIAIAAA